MILNQLNSDLGYYITSVDDFSHTLIGGAAQNITLNSKITLEQYARILFLNYPDSNDGALLAIAPGDKIITAFRNNGVWEEKSSHFIATKSDLDKGQFVVKVEENIQKVITSQSDIVRGTLPSQMKDCAYAAIGFSEFVDNELSIVVDGNSIIVSPKKSNNAVTINWFQFN